MKMLRFGSMGVLMLGIVMLSFAIFSEKSKESKDRSLVVAATSKNNDETPVTIRSDEGLDDADDSDDTPKIMITGTTDIPFYPDAQLVRLGKGDYYNKPGGGDYTFWSDSSLDKVVSFYKRELAKNGWTLVEDGWPDSSGNSVSLDFGWINPVKEMPLRRHIAISVIGQPIGCEVWLRFERWPDPEYVPLYPGAQQVQVTWVKVYPDVDYFERLTTYETKATATEIEAYYNDDMVQHGWAMVRIDPPTHLFYKYRHDLRCPPQSALGMRCGTGSLIDVRLYPQENGTTKVELRIGGGEIQASYKGK